MAPRLIGSCFAIMDMNVRIRKADRVSMMRRDILPAGVQFLNSQEFHRVRATLLDQYLEAISWQPGGPISNAMCSFANQLGPFPRPWLPVWSGPTCSEAHLNGDPLSTLRHLGIRTISSSIANSQAESICFVDAVTGESLGIYVGPRPQKTVWTPDDLNEEDHYFMLLSDLASCPHDSALFRSDCSVSLAVADEPSMDVGVRDLLFELASAGKLRHLFCTMDDLQRLSLASKSLIVSELSNVEIVATDGGGPVHVSSSGQSMFDHEMAVTEPLLEPMSLLGAGDAYAGAYLAQRLMLKSVWDAHRAGVREARRVSYSNSARREVSANLTTLFGAAIDRSSETPDWAIFEQLRIGHEFSVISCGNSGVDSYALSAAASLGVVATAVMPAGQRREGLAEECEGRDLVELGSSSFRYCTWSNVYLADGTILYDVGGGEGSAETRRAASALNRPILELGRDTQPEDIREWVVRNDIRVLNFAGSRLSNFAGMDFESVNAIVSRAVSVAVCARARADGPRWSEVDPVEPSSAALGIPRLPEVRDFILGVLGLRGVEQLAIPYEGGNIVLGKSMDLVEMVESGRIGAAFVGSDMVQEFICTSPHRFSLWGATGAFPCLITYLTASDALGWAERVVAQYPGIARSQLAPLGVDVIPIRGSGEGWVMASIADGLVDTFRTGRSAHVHGLEVDRILLRSSLCLILSPSVGPWEIALSRRIWEGLIQGHGRVNG